MPYWSRRAEVAPSKPMKAGKDGSGMPREVTGSSSHQIFYSVFLPVGAVVNLVLGLIVLRGIDPLQTISWLQLGTGAFCCMISGWLAAAAWSRFYWSKHMMEQVTMWRRISGTFFTWLEEAPLPAESLKRLKSSLDEVVPSASQR